MVLVVMGARMLPEVLFCGADILRGSVDDRAEVTLYRSEIAERQRRGRVGVVSGG